MVEPEDGFKGRVVQVVHVAARFAANGNMYGIVNRLEAVHLAATTGDGANLRGADESPTWDRTCGEEVEDTVTQGDSDIAYNIVHSVVVAAGGIGDRAAQGRSEVVPRTRSNLARKHATGEAV